MATAKAEMTRAGHRETRQPRDQAALPRHRCRERHRKEPVLHGARPEQRRGMTRRESARNNWAGGQWHAAVRFTIEPFGPRTGDGHGHRRNKSFGEPKLHLA